MVSRALNLATVTLLMGCLAAGAAHAQATNLEAGKSPSQIFAGTCNACHKSPRGLLKTVPASSLPGYLRQHYTTSSDMASVLSSYLVSNGATDTRYQAKQEPGKQGRDAKQEPKQEPKQEAGKPAGPPDHIDRFGRRQRPATPAQEAGKPEVEPAAKPDADGLAPQGEGGRAGRNAKRLARPGEAPDAATDSKSGAKQKLSKRGKGGEELPKPEAAKPDTAKEEPASSEPPKEEAVKTETAKTAPANTDAGKADTSKADKADTSKTDNAKTDAAKDEADQPEGTQPAPKERSESAKVDAPRETGGSEPAPLRPDPVPPVAPAPSTPAAPPAPAASGTAEPAASPSAPAPPAAPVRPPVTAVVPPSAPQAAPAGPPEPPISR